MTAITSKDVILLQEAVDTRNDQLGQSHSDCIWKRVIGSDDFELFKESLNYMLSVQNPPKFLLDLKWKYLTYVCAIDRTQDVLDESHHVQQFVGLGHACSKLKIAACISETGLRCIRIFKAAKHMKAVKDMNESPVLALLSTTQRLEVLDADIEQASLKKVSKLYGKSVVELEFYRSPSITSLENCHFRAEIKVKGLAKPWAISTLFT